MKTSHPREELRDMAPQNSTSAHEPAPNFKNHSMRGPPAQAGKGEVVGVK
jgi:hypothetical protein